MTALSERLTLLAIKLSDAGFTEQGVTPADAQALAMEVSELAQIVQEKYVLADDGGEIPTAAQGVALARFLRPQFRDGVRDAFATVARGGFDLPKGYIQVRLADGYNGGIDRDGRTST